MTCPHCGKEIEDALRVAETRMLPGEVVRVMRDGLYRVLLVGGSLPITLPGVCLRSSPEREKVGKK